MADAPSDQNKTAEPPAPEVLKPRDEEAGTESAAKAPAEAPKALKRPRRATYHPSHKATFIGLAVIVAILAVNAGIIAFVLKSQSKHNGSVNQDQVTLSQGSLDKLGVNRSAVGDLGVLLTVGPDAKFNGMLTVGKDVSVAGQLKLNSKFTANDASLAQLEAGNTSVQKLDVNGDTTSGNLNLRQDLQVAGTSRLQGPTIMGQLLTVNNNVNISGSVSIGGTLSVNSFHASSLTSDTTLTIGGHILTRGTAPGIGAGPSLGQNGTVSISGNDAAGTIAVNVGVGGGGGTLANISFRQLYSNVPHVIVEPVGAAVPNLYVNRSAAGFSIAVSGSLAAGNYVFDYIVEQ